MDGKALRTIAVMGLITVVVLALLMTFSLKQVTDTATPRIAAAVKSEMERALAPAPPEAVRLTMTRKGKALDAPRVYVLRLRPNEAVAADERALERFMQRGAELVALELDSAGADVTIQSVAELPGGGKRERTFACKGGFGSGIVEPVAEAVAAEPGAR